MGSETEAHDNQQMSGNSENYRPAYPEVRIAHAEPEDDLAGLLRFDMSREQLADYLDEVGEDLDENEKAEQTALLIEIGEPFGELERALDELHNYPAMVVTPVEHGDVDDSAPSDELVSISIILNKTQVQSLHESLEKARNAGQSSFVWRHDLQPKDARIFLLQAAEALEMDSPGLATEIVE